MNIVGSGRVLLLAEAPLNKPHVWFVLTDPEGDPPRVVAVMVRSARSFTDPTVVLQPGDHPFIRHESSVHFSTARWFKVSAIMRAIESGRCHIQPDIMPELLKRVRVAVHRQRRARLLSRPVLTRKGRTPRITKRARGKRPASPSKSSPKRNTSPWPARSPPGHKRRGREQCPRPRSGGETTQRPVK